jgi:cytochrome c oxidase subunit I
MRRRIIDYDPALGLEPMQMIVTIAGFVIAIALLIFFVQLDRQHAPGEVAVGNVWESRSPEWQIASPPPAHNFDGPVTVVGDPYDYGLPGSRYVDLDGVQARPVATPAD